jgi:hypothetical protein
MEQLKRDLQEKPKSLKEGVATRKAEVKKYYASQYQRQKNQNTGWESAIWSRWQWKLEYKNALVMAQWKT